MIVSGVLWATLCGAAERPPDLFHSAPIIPWAKKVGENRYRSPRNFDGTVEYYQKVLRGEWRVSWHKIINVSGTRAKHIKNLKPNGRWEGINIYEFKGSTYVFVVFSDAELERIEAKEKKRRKASKSSL
ncbi:MAG: hypothetical protein JXR96_13700 [Deltaproteobacteria bacterium]|nr:hypothetical protein [Deltaproteobacteria bacterium]